METTKSTVIILNFRTNWFGHKSADPDQSHQGLLKMFDISFHLHHFEVLVEPLSLNFREYKAKPSGINFTVLASS